jgi:hypothetical protein
LKFLGEVWAGRACAGANEEELTTCGKIWGQSGRKEGAGGLDKGGPTQERLATAGRLTACGPRATTCIDRARRFKKYIFWDFF